MNYKTWSIILFAIFMLLFLMLALFKSDVTTWIWQLALPILVVAQVLVILKAKDQSKKEFKDEWYDHK
ncbi:MAG: hypothetical protein R3330_12030 [Saprospiraceae bacterium]|nr:hypothetical protein [Saprospiraceae bacterium]